MSSTWGQQSPQPQRHGLQPRTAIWLLAGLAIAVVLIRTHHIHTYQLLMFAVLIPSVILHEVTHGAVALGFGDDTAKRAHRLTLNPIPHIDPFGTIILPALLLMSGFGGFGYARPVPVNVSRLRHPRNESVVVSLAGPMVNILLAVGCGLAYAHLVPGSIKQMAIFPSGNQPTQPIWAQLLFFAGYVNVILAVFNLIPLPPLDGSAVVERLLPTQWLPAYYRIRPFTMFLPLAVILLFPQVLDHIFTPALDHWASAVGI